MPTLMAFAICMKISAEFMNALVTRMMDRTAIRMPIKFQQPQDPYLFGVSSAQRALVSLPEQ